METSGNREPRSRAALTRRWHPDERQWLEDFLAAIGEQHDDVVSRVVLFGSKARGESNDDSDIDVLVIVKDEGAARKKTIEWMAQDLAVPSYAVPSVMTRTEGQWAELEAVESPFQRAVELEGIELR